MELSSIGGKYSWTNDSPGPNFIQSKLDRAFANQLWIDTWPEARVVLHNGSSDHKGMIITILQVEKGSKPFRVYNYWLEDPKFLDLVKKGLATNYRGTGLYNSNKN